MEVPIQREKAAEVFSAVPAIKAGKMLTSLLHKEKTGLLLPLTLRGVASHT